MNNKTQTEKLIENMEQGRKYNMLTAFYTLNVQDLRKRLSDIRRCGYNLESSKDVWLSGAPDDQGTLRSWGIRNPLKVGDFVKVVAAPVLPCGTHPLRGKIGTVVKKRDHHFHVADAQGRVFGKFRHKDLLKIAEHSKGQTVTLTRVPLEVQGFEPQSSTYILSDGVNRFFAEASLLNATVQ